MVSSTKFFMPRIIFLLLIGALAISNIAHAKIVKWVDSKGVTHYGDKLPPQEAGRSNSVISKEGMVIRKNDPSINSAAKTEIDQKLAEQNRMDSSLLASYSSEEEIDLAKSRNIKADETALDSLNQHLKAVNVTLIKNMQTVADLQKRKQKIPASLTEQIKNNQADINKTLTHIETTKKSIADISLRYENEKKRYVEIKPRNQSLKDIKDKKKSLAELEAWKSEAQNRLNALQKEAVYYKRVNASIPDSLSARILQTTQELNRANDEINVAKANLKKHEQAFSK
jgi:DNA repair exonuclease SbcCD ATPase subunit